MNAKKPRLCCVCGMEGNETHTNAQKKEKKKSSSWEKIFFFENETIVFFSLVVVVVACSVHLYSGFFFPERRHASRPSLLFLSPWLQEQQVVSTS